MREWISCHHQMKTYFNLCTIVQFWWEKTNKPTQISLSMSKIFDLLGKINDDISQQGWLYNMKRWNTDSLASSDWYHRSKPSCSVFWDPVFWHFYLWLSQSRRLDPLILLQILLYQVSSSFKKNTYINMYGMALLPK